MIAGMTGFFTVFPLMFVVTFVLIDSIIDQQLDAAGACCARTLPHR